MEKSLSTSNSKFPSAAILAVAMALVLELSLGFMPKAFWSAIEPYTFLARDDSLRFRVEIETFTPTHETQVVLLGSSQLREGIDPAQVRSILSNTHGVDTDVLSLGMTGARSLDFYLQMKQVLRTSPELIVLMPTWNFAFEGNPQQRMKYYSYSLGDIQKSLEVFGDELLDNRLKREFLIDAMLVNIFPSYRFTHAYYIFSVIGNIIYDKRAPERSYVYTKKKSEQYFEKQVHRITKAPFQINLDDARTEKAFFDATLLLAREANVDVVVVDGPTNPRMDKALMRFTPIWNRYTNMVKEAVEKHDAGYVDRSMLPTFEPEDFIDVTHLSDLGRKKFDVFIAKIIAKEIRKRCSASDVR